MSQNRSGSCLPRRRSGCLGSICGTSIDLEDVRFSGRKPNLVYMDKVFSYNDATGCPLVVPINTGGPGAPFFRTKLTLTQNGCCCNTCRLEPNAVFTVEDSTVLVEIFELSTGAVINRNQVTVDGFPVDSITQMGGQFMAETNSLIPRIQKERCLENQLPTKTFFLISGAGPFTIRVRFIITGTVNTGGKCCCFRLEIENAPNAPSIRLPSDRLSNFAIRDLSLPCIIKGIAPVIRFQFDARAQLQNPILRVNCGRDGCAPGCGEPVGNPGCNQGCNQGCGCDCDCDVVLSTNLVIEPAVQVEVIRKTLFCVDACEAQIPCQGTFEEVESEREECPNPFAPDCFCGSRPNVGGIITSDGCGCNQGCGNNCGCQDHCHPGIQPRTAPTAFQLCGSGGCCW